MTVTKDVVTDRRTEPAAEERTMLARRFAVLDIDRNGVWQRAGYQRLTQRLCETFGHPAISQFFTSRDPGAYGNLAFGHP